MYIITYVYNTLNCLVRGIKNIVTSMQVMVNVSVMLIPLGFTFVIAAFGLELDLGTRITFMIVGIIGILGGLIITNRIYDKVLKKEEKEVSKEQKVLDDLLGIKTAIESMNANIGNLVKEIRLDREQREKQ